MTNWITIEKAQQDALYEALYLALTAPTDEKAQEASALAEGIAQGMSADEVEACKAEALADAKSDGFTYNH